MAKRPAKGHHGHAYCGRLCVPQWLFDEFQSILGPKSEDFDVLTWMPRQDAEFAHCYGVIPEPLTAWREAFQIELAMRGFAVPKPKRFMSHTRTEPDFTRLGSGDGKYIVPCPHANICQNTRQCCLRQDVERIAARQTPAAAPDPEERPDWWDR